MSYNFGILISLAYKIVFIFFFEGELSDIFKMISCSLIMQHIKFGA